ncbi:hypothetical protein [Chitinolyticbacter albus]|uniref:hypothetical protein n=1 Tax=Chitinolyticbacter albus TaxID=2961951 RepID=UPI0021097B40|nr:hypothetical protein [Chitinolyticbacter albus]
MARNFLLFSAALLIITGAVMHFLGPFSFMVGSAYVTLALPWQQRPSALRQLEVVLEPAGQAGDYQVPVEQVEPAPSLENRDESTRVKRPSAPEDGVYKCKSSSGGVLYQQTPCERDTLKRDTL